MTANGKKSGPTNVPDKPAVTLTLTATVDKIIPAISPNEPDKAQIAIDGGEHLYKEIRIDNVLEDDKGHKVKLKSGAQVDVTIAAASKDTVPDSPDK